MFGLSGFWEDLLCALIAALFVVGVMVGLALLIELLPGG